MSSDSVGTVETRNFTFAAPPDGLLLESGKTLGPVTIAYETYGRLNRERSNAILVCHALSGDAHAAGFLKGENIPGWWENMIGPGKAFGTEQYFASSRQYPPFHRIRQDRRARVRQKTRHASIA